MSNFVPRNEQGVVVLFAMLAKEIGWEFVEIGASFPDAILCKNGEVWRVEFEFRASNFIDHKHDIRECDMIVCWENDYIDCPLPIISLNKPDEIGRTYIKCDQYLKEIAYWKNRASRAEQRVKVLSRSVKDARSQIQASQRELTSSERQRCEEVTKVVSENRVRTWDDLEAVSGWAKKTAQRYGKLAKDAGYIAKDSTGVYRPTQIATIPAMGIVTANGYHA